MKQVGNRSERGGGRVTYCRRSSKDKPAGILVRPRGMTITPRCTPHSPNGFVPPYGPAFEFLLVGPPADQKIHCPKRRETRWADLHT
jgi:hypothetical protein